MMLLMDEILQAYSDEVRRLAAARSTTELSYYPAIKALLSKMLVRESLPFEVRASTSESRSGGGHDLPDIALYDGQGEFLVVCGEVKLPSQEIRQLAVSEERNDQIGRYLVQTGVVLMSNVRGFGLLTIRRGALRGVTIAPADRVLEHVVEIWPSSSAMEQGRTHVDRPWVRLAHDPPWSAAWRDNRTSRSRPRTCCRNLSFLLGYGTGSCHPEIRRRGALPAPGNRSHPLCADCGAGIIGKNPPPPGEESKGPVASGVRPGRQRACRRTSALPCGLRIGRRICDSVVTPFATISQKLG